MVVLLLGLYVIDTATLLPGALLAFRRMVFHTIGAQFAVTRVGGHFFGAAVLQTNIRF